MASVDQCMTQVPRTRWALNCTVTFECLLGYRLEGEPKFICKNGYWEPDEDIPSCKYQIRSYSYIHFKLTIKIVLRNLIT